MNTNPAPLKLVEPQAAEPVTRHPWFKFYPDAWLADELLVMCSMAARGLLAALMCLMHRAKPYGYLLVAGKAPTDAELTRLVRGASVVETRRLREELTGRGVLSVTADGVLYSRRMVRAAAKSARDRDHGSLGGNPSLKPASGLTGGLTTIAPAPLTGGDNTQSTEDRRQTPIPPSVLTDETLGKRAAAFLARVPVIYAKCRNGVSMRVKEARDFPTAIELVELHQDDDRLDALYEVFLRMASSDCRGMNKPGTVNQFASYAPECDRLLREHGR